MARNNVPLPTTGLFRGSALVGGGKNRDNPKGKKRRKKLVKIEAPGKEPLVFKKGALTEQAARYGMTPKEFCASEHADTPLAKKRCNFAFKGALAKGRETAAKKRKKKK